MKKEYIIVGIILLLIGAYYYMNQEKAGRYSRADCVVTDLFGRCEDITVLYYDEAGNPIIVANEPTTSGEVETPVQPIQPYYQPPVTNTNTNTNNVTTPEVTISKEGEWKLGFLFTKTMAIGILAVLGIVYYINQKHGKKKKK